MSLSKNIYVVSKWKSYLIASFHKGKEKKNLWQMPEPNEVIFMNLWGQESQDNFCSFPPPTLGKQALKIAP